MTSVKITVLTIEGLKPSEYYLIEEIEAFGFKDALEFCEQCVCVVFRVVVRDQVFPIRIWLRRSDVPEDNWVRAAKKKAAEIMGLANDAVAPWIAL